MKVRGLVPLLVRLLRTSAQGMAGSIVKYTIDPAKTVINLT